MIFFHHEKLFCKKAACQVLHISGFLSSPLDIKLKAAGFNCQYAKLHKKTFFVGTDCPKERQINLALIIIIFQRDSIWFLNHTGSGFTNLFFGGIDAYFLHVYQM